MSNMLSTWTLPLRNVLSYNDTILGTYFQEEIKLWYICLHFIYSLKILYLKKLTCMTMEALTKPEVIKHL